MERKQIKSLGFTMGFYLNFYLGLKHLVVLIKNPKKTTKDFITISIFQLVTMAMHCLFHVKQTFSLINRYLSTGSILCSRKVIHEIIFRIDGSYIQFPIPLVFIKGGVVKASGFAL